MKNVLVVEGYVVIKISTNIINADMVIRWEHLMEQFLKDKVDLSKHQYLGVKIWVKQIRLNIMIKKWLGNNLKNIGKTRNMEAGCSMIPNSQKRIGLFLIKLGKQQVKFIVKKIILHMYLIIQKTYKKIIIHQYIIFLLWMNQLQWKVKIGIVCL